MADPRTSDARSKVNTSGNYNMLALDKSIDKRSGVVPAEKTPKSMPLLTQMPTPIKMTWRDQT